MSESRRPDWLGIILGLAVFLLGIAILVFTFLQASEFFAQSPDKVVKKEDVDVAQVGKNFADVVLQIGKLLVMSGIGSMISSRGVRMYQAARHTASRDPHER